MNGKRPRPLRNLNLGTRSSNPMVAAVVSRTSPEEVDKAVHDKYDSFADSAVRDFVPVLVERATRQRLAGERHGSGRA